MQNYSAISNCNLILLDPKNEEWYCNHCHVSYFPNKGEKVKRPNKFETPGPETDSKGNIIGYKVPIVSMVNDDNKSTEPSSVYTGPKLPPSFENLAKCPGVKILDYHTTEY
jgi:hypothetical protein